MYAEDDVELPYLAHEDVVPPSLLIPTSEKWTASAKKSSFLCKLAVKQTTSQLSKETLFQPFHSISFAHIIPPVSSIPMELSVPI